MERIQKFCEHRSEPLEMMKNAWDGGLVGSICWLEGLSKSIP